MYIDKIFAKFYLNQAKTSNILMKETFILPNKSKKAITAKRKHYQGMTTSIIFLMVKTRPDIVYATSVVSRFTKNLSHLHSKAVKTIFCYLKAIRDVKIIYGGEQRGELTIRRYSDSNWACNHITTKSTLGFIFMLNSRLVS